MKHTPGPWFADKQSPSGWVSIYAIEQDGRKTLPFAVCKHFNEVENARLIAAAPDLLEALQLLLDIERGGDQGGSFREWLYAAFRKAEKAVSIATGEQQ
jgi:hypothetical protein